MTDEEYALYRKIYLKHYKATHRNKNREYCKRYRDKKKKESEKNGKHGN